MRRLVLAALLLLPLPLRVAAEGERAGDFDYYILALSWTPTWCALEGDGRGAPECARGQQRGFSLHGLWPQHEEGWPSWCRSAATPPTRRQTARMTDVMGSAGLAYHQWRKHGTCSGLDAERYFTVARRAYDAVRRPAAVEALGREVTLPAKVIEEAFLEANPALKPDGLTVTCREGRVQEVRICLTKSLAPRRCGDDVARDCTLSDALLSPVR